MTNGKIALKQIWPTATHRQVESETEREKGEVHEVTLMYLTLNFYVSIYSYSVKHLSLNEIDAEG
jgi:hypothetical protein